MAEPWKVSEAYGTDYAAPSRYNTYQNAQRDYQNSRYALNDSNAQWVDPVTLGWGENSNTTPGYWQSNVPQPNIDTVYQDWRNTLTPRQQAEYDQVTGAKFSKGSSTGRGGFIAALAAMTGGAALAAEAGTVGAGAGAGFGAGDAGAGMGWMGGAELGTDAAAYGGLGSGLLPAGEFMGAGAGGTWAGTEAAKATSPFGKFMQQLGTSALSKLVTGATSGSGGGSGGNPLSQLIGAGLTAYQGNKGAKQYENVINEINNLYGTDSPYAKQMKQAMERKDAAAGRNSQYGDRAVQLAAALTQAKSNALLSPGYQGMIGNRITQQNQPTNALSALFGSGAGQNLITQAGNAIGNGVNQYFTNSGTPVGGISDWTNPNAAAGDGGWWDVGSSADWGIGP